MIILTRLDGREILINEQYIEIIEETPDTVLTFQNGHRLFVREKLKEILDKSKQYRRGIAEENSSFDK